MRLTQEEMAHEIGITVGTLNRWENGKFTPSRMACRMIEAAVARLAEERGWTAERIALAATR